MLINRLSQSATDLIQENCHYIKSVAEVLLLTATQNIAQRGHRGSEDHDHKGNFMAILQLFANHDTVAKNKVHEMLNGKWK